MVAGRCLFAGIDTLGGGSDPKFCLGGHQAAG